MKTVRLLGPSKLVHPSLLWTVRELPKLTFVCLATCMRGYGDSSRSERTPRISRRLKVDPSQRNAEGHASIALINSVKSTANEEAN